MAGDGLLVQARDSNFKLQIQTTWPPLYPPALSRPAGRERELTAICGQRFLTGRTTPRPTESFVVLNRITAFSAEQSSTVPTANSSHHTTSAYTPKRLVLTYFNHTAK
jgi:hypothetical protein